MNPTPPLNPTPQVDKVLRVFLEAVDEPRYGYELMRRTGLKSGTLYPILARLEAQAVVEADWQPPDQTLPGRPPRRFYRLTGAGVATARQLVAEASQTRETASRSRRGLLPGVEGGRA
ncbi:MAG TPA: PadR family transcriptional regulator [Kineosporiaceae bacterium]|nr:PadR family transcriptional regulator [Kineosporiaceae bacterium]